ncbi:MAG: hypothetical protein ABIH49_02240 [archaeon]
MDEENIGKILKEISAKLGAINETLEKGLSMIINELSGIGRS